MWLNIHFINVHQLHKTNYQLYRTCVELGAIYTIHNRTELIACIVYSLYISCVRSWAYYWRIPNYISWNIQNNIEIDFFLLVTMQLPLFYDLNISQFSCLLNMPIGNITCSAMIFVFTSSIPKTFNQEISWLSSVMIIAQNSSHLCGSIVAGGSKNVRWEYFRDFSFGTKSRKWRSIILILCS